VEFFVALVDLLEAEGRSLRHATVRLGVSLVLFAAAGLIGAVGLCLCLWGLYQYLALSYGGVTAAVSIGVVSLLLAGGILWIAQRISQ
jgi:hypothetical protein